MSTSPRLAALCLQLHCNSNTGSPCHASSLHSAMWRSGALALDSSGHSSSSISASGRGSISTLLVQPAPLSGSASSSSSAAAGSCGSPSSSFSSSSCSGLLRRAPSLGGIPRLWWGQLCWLALNLTCCGAIVGLCRLLPRLASERFALGGGRSGSSGGQHYSALLLFVTAFGLSKAGCNLLVGGCANLWGRRRLLRVGWGLACLTPLLLWLAESWAGVLVATAVLGASQGLCTSAAVVMVLDVVPLRARGASMGALECCIYVSLGLGALAAAEILNRCPLVMLEIATAATATAAATVDGVAAAAATTTTGLVADFRPVFVLHFLLCGLGGLASWRAQETRHVALKQDAPEPLSPSHRHEHADQDEDENQDEEQGQGQLQLQQLQQEWNNSLRPSSPLKISSRSNTNDGSTLPASHLLLHTLTPTAATPMASPGGAVSSSLQLRFPTAVTLVGDHAVIAMPQSPPSRSPRATVTGSTGAPASPSFSSAPAAATSFLSSLRVSARDCFCSPILRAIVQAGFFNNLKDGVCWGLLPGFLSGVGDHGSSGDGAPPGKVGLLLTAYPLMWGLGQLFTGQASDHFARRRGRFISGGLAMQALALATLAAVPSLVAHLSLAWPAALLGTEEGQLELAEMRFVAWLCALLLLGFGTALSYPVLQAYIGDVVAPSRRAGAIGLYRLVRDLGYAGGGALSGALADAYGTQRCMQATAALIALSAAYAFMALPAQDATTATCNTATATSAAAAAAVTTAGARDRAAAKGQLKEAA